MADEQDQRGRGKGWTGAAAKHLGAKGREVEEYSEAEQARSS